MGARCCHPWQHTVLGKATRPPPDGSPRWRWGKSCRAEPGTTCPCAALRMCFSSSIRIGEDESRAEPGTTCPCADLWTCFSSSFRTGENESCRAAPGTTGGLLHACRPSVECGGLWVHGTLSAMDGATELTWVRAHCLRGTASHASERTAASGWAGPRSGTCSVSREPTGPRTAKEHRPQGFGLGFWLLPSISAPKFAMHPRSRDNGRLRRAWRPFLFQPKSCPCPSFA